MPPPITIGQRGISIRIILSPNWDILARRFAVVTEDVLHREIGKFAQAIGQEMLQQIHTGAMPLSFTGRLANVENSWESRTTELGRASYLTVVKLRASTPTVPESIGRPVGLYTGPIEWGTGAHARPWGKMARLRMEAWAEAKIGDRRRARYVMAAIFKHGTRAHPYFVPAARATARAAMDWAEIYGMNWRDGVEAELKARF